MTERIAVLKELHQQKLSIQKQLKCGIISYVDSANELQMIQRKEAKIKKDLVDEVHVTKTGAKRSISYNEAKGLWTTKMPDGTHVTGKSIESLYDNLFAKYGLLINEYTIRSVFELAIDEKARTENNNPQTIEHYHQDFKRYISDEFASKDIRSITKADAKEYTQNLVHRIYLTKKAFLNYKCLLNLIFNYACEYDIIGTNPICAINNQVYLKSCDCGNQSSEKNILSETELDIIREEIRKRSLEKIYNGYFINGYAMLLAMETGMRAAELCSFKWSDVYDTYIHIHSQQLSRKVGRGKEYYYAPWTKDEKGISKGGRYFPMTHGLKAILDELKALQRNLGISSEYVLCHEDGTWINTDAYEKCLWRLMNRLEMPVTNNHAFRKSLNSNVLIPMGFNEVERSAMMGHSVETNLKHYTFQSKDLINQLYRRFADTESEVDPWSPQNIILLSKRKSLSVM